MMSRYQLAEIAGLLADPSRAGMVLSLWDGRARPAGELAALAGVTRATASSHLARLVAGKILRVEPHGRHRYFRLASAEVARALESLGPLAGRPAAAPTLSPARAALRAARLCYDHLAGELGVAIADALLARRLLSRRADEYALTPAGRRWFAELDVDVFALDGGRRPLVRVCLDWTERREHISGALGATLATNALERGWVRRQRDTRALTVTPTGRRELLAPLQIRAG
jgi:DNA-binding transcriptional ArsR family regulator